MWEDEISKRWVRSWFNILKIDDSQTFIYSKTYEDKPTKQENWIGISGKFVYLLQMLWILRNFL